MTADATRARMLAIVMRSDPDVATAAVLADWCEEVGFLPAAEDLRSGDIMRWASALDVLSAAFGLAGRYDVMVTFPITHMHGAESMQFRARAESKFRVRRLVIPSPIAAMLRVDSFRIGRTFLIDDDEERGVDGDMFSPERFDTFDEVVSGPVVLTLTNASVNRLDVHPCILGSRVRA